MYLTHFGLAEAPFSITPDPSFIYLSGRHRDALAHLLYGVGQGGSGGFVQLTGEVGTGKTTLCRALLEQVPEGTRIALVLNPLMNPVEMLAAICEELAIDTTGVEHSTKGLVDRLNDYLLAVHEAGGRVVLVIDEAQNLSPESLEQVRLLTNLETSKQKLLQIILLGQPELRELLQRRSLRQLAQRITARYHLTPLGREETAAYLTHRMQVAGATRDPFTRSGRKAVFQRSQGVPRLINIIADRALTGAFARETDRVDAKIVHAAADEVQLGEPGVRRVPWMRWAGAAAALLILLSATVWVTRTLGPAPAAETAGTAPGGPQQDAATVNTAQASGLEAGSSAMSAGDENSNVRSAGMDTGDEIVDARDSSLAVASPTSSAGSGKEVPAEEPGPAAPVLDETWFETQDLRAFQGLGEAWGRPGDGALIEASCLGREGLGFACVEDQGNWLRIRQLGLPVVLVLPGGEPAHVLLTGMEGERIRVGTGMTAQTVDRTDVEARWFGAFLVAWPQDPNWPREIGVGDRGEAVERVLDLAKRADEPYAGPGEFGADFEQWLVAFQVRHGLNPDGIVGPKTLLYLMRFSIEEPRLLTALDLGA